MKVAVVIEDYNLDDYDFLIGVENGSTKKQVDIAIGDFDSIDKKNINAKKIIEFKPEKDYTDTYLAVMEALKLSKDITIVGGIQGNRIEHLIANLNILIKYPFIKMIDKNSKIFIIENDYEFEYSTDYYSFYAVEESIISLKGFKYDVENYVLKPFDSLCISNELISDGLINVKGKIIAIISKK